MGLKITKELLEALLKKIKVGNNRSPHLNAMVGKSATRADIVDIDDVSYGFMDNFMHLLLKDEPFSLKFKLGDDRAYEKYKEEKIEKNPEIEESEILKEFTQKKGVALKRVKSILNQQDDILSETGIPSFGFGFPMVVRNETSPLYSKTKLIVAPLIVRNLELEVVRGEKDTFVINKTEDLVRSSNGILSSHINIIDNIDIPELGEEESLGEEQLAEYITKFFRTFNQTFDDYSELYNLKSLPSKQRLEKDVGDKFQLYMSGTFGIFKQQKETIKVSMKEMYDNFDDIFVDKESKELEYEHTFGAVEQDPSQTQILNTLGKDNPNIIIQGPPGTGKSHTIKAILTNALQHKHSSLVICEKRTALEVIAKGLDELGLKDSYVIIEDARKDRKKIIEKVRGFIDNGGTYTQAPISYKTALSKQNRLIDEINSVHKSLSKKVYGDIEWNQLIGKVLRGKSDLKDEKIIEELCKFFKDKIDGDRIELFNRYSEMVNIAGELYEQNYEKIYKDINKFFINQVSHFDAFKNYENINSLIKKNIQDLCNDGTELSNGSKNYINGINDLISEIGNNLDVFIKGVNNIYVKIQPIMNTKGLRFLNLLTEKCNELKTKQNGLRKISYDEDSLINDKTYEKIETELGKIDSIAEEIENEVKSYNAYIEDVYGKTKNLETLIKKGKQILGEDFLLKAEHGGWDSFIGRFSSKQKGINDLKAEVFKSFFEFNESLAIYFTTETNYDSNLTIFDILNFLNTDKTYLEQLHLESYNRPNIKGLQNQWNKINDIKKNIKITYANLITNGNWYEAKTPIEVTTKYELNNAIGIIKAKTNTYILGSNDFFKVYKWGTFENNLSKEDAKLIKLFFNLTKTEDWLKYLQYGFFESILREEYKGNLSDIDEKIKELTSVMQNFRKMQLENIKHNVRYSKNNAIDHFHSQHGQEPKILYALRAAKGQKAKSLRYMVRYDTNFFKGFFPIILTNPVTCAQLFKTEKDIFDLVIFDEASQLRVEDTIQCLIRGKKKIVCGDDKQMPPSDYFGTTLTIDGKENDEDEEDDLIGLGTMVNEESLLSFADNQGFTSTMLKIHYRSQHPYLIDFSNTAYYNGQLQPFPSKTDYTPIEFVECEGNYYEGVNEMEADKVIEILCNIIKHYDEDHLPPIGIATFNIKQRFHILDKINELRTQDNEIGNKLNKYNANNFFVKNLDSIQGDERDIIIVSTTFGKNKNDGKFAQQFGPINTKNGFRYLNVMITRSKKKMIVVSGVPSNYYLEYEEELKKVGGAYGKAGFYSRLAYVKSVSDKNEDMRKHILNSVSNYTGNSGHSNIGNIEGHTESPFEEEVVEELTKIFPNLKIELQKWVAGFRLDISIETPTGKKIAIECDGANYHSSEEAYAWDIFRQKEIENSCGYIFHRIWSTNRWLDQDNEIKKMTEFLKRHGA